MEARGAASIRDPEGQGVCEMEAWITNTETPRRWRRCGERSRQWGPVGGLLSTPSLSGG